MAVIDGTPASEPLNGTAGNDTISGAGGADTIAMLGGSDLALWSLGDGSDVVEGGTGTDTARFSSAGGLFTVSASGSGTVFVATGAGGGAEITSLNDVERLELLMSAFYNIVTIDDLSGSDVTKVTVDFAGANDFLAAYASGANNTISVTAAGIATNVAGLPTLFSVTHADASDFLELHGANGNDKMSGAALGAGRIRLGLSGDDGNDSLTGSVGDDGLGGGTGNDTVTGGRGNDSILLGSGNDLVLWNAGDGFDTIEGGADFDTVRITGSNADEGLSPASFNLAEIERVEIRPLGGADFISVNNMAGAGITAVAIDLAATAGGKAADTKVDIIDIGPEDSNDSYVLTSVGGKIFISGLGAEVSIDHASKIDVLRITGGLGNDLIDASALAAGKISLDLLGNSNNDTIKGSAGDDKVLEAGGNDQLFLGAGNDVVEWNGSSGDDLIEGGAGLDTFILSASGDGLSIVANSGRAFLARSDGASIDMDDVERIQFGAHTAAASFTVGDLTGAGIQQVAIDLADISGKTGNGLVDSIGITATGGNDTIGATIGKGVVSVTGLASQVTIAHGESSDIIIINTFGGDDVIDMSKLPVTALMTSPRGGTGNDTILASARDDLLFGENGNDRLTGGRGNDSINPGLGDDLIIWKDGDGSDDIFDDAGTDTLRFTGSAAGEAIQLSFFDPGRFTLDRTLAAVHLLVGHIERVEIATLGGADTVGIGDLSLAGVTEVAVDLASTVGGKAADAAVDTVSIDGTGADNNILLSLTGTKLVAVGLPTQVSIDHAGKTDLLLIHGGAGNDFVDASIIPAGKVGLRLFGDGGDDFIWSSAGDDVVEGGFGNDFAILGAGNDAFTWFSGDGNDKVEGQAGTDNLNLIFTSGPDGLEVAANGNRVNLAVASEGALLDTDDVERFQIQAAGGPDSIAVHDLAGTDAKLVSIDLGTSLGPTGDGQGDIVSVDGGSGADTVTASLVAGAVTIKGLAAQVSIAHVEAIDTLYLNGFGGDDSISAAAVPTKSGQLILIGGAGNDKLTGNLGNNVLYGGDDNDNLNGGGGNDTLTGSLGNDTITGGAGSDAIFYTSVLDGHDLVVGFDGNAAGGQDVLDLDVLFDNLGVSAGNRADRVAVIDKGASVEIVVDTDGNLSFDLAVATLKTADVIAVGQDVLVGS